MKKLITISILLLVITCSVLIYRYMTDDYIPDNRRAFYSEINKNDVIHAKEVQIKSVSSDSKLYEEYDKKKLEKGEVQDSAKYFLELSHRLATIKKDCESEYKENVGIDIDLPDVLSDESGSKLEDFKNDLLSVLSDSLLSTFQREGLLDMVISLREKLNSIKTMPVNQYVLLFKSLLICREGDMDTYIESLYDLELNKGQEKHINSIILTAIKKQIESGDVLPDNLIFSINILRNLGRRRDLGEQYEEDIEDIFERISRYDEFYYEEFSEMKEIENPGFFFQAYLDEMTIISEDLKRIMVKNFRELED